MGRLLNIFYFVACLVLPASLLYSILYSFQQSSQSILLIESTLLSLFIFLLLIWDKLLLINLSSRKIPLDKQEFNFLHNVTIKTGAPDVRFFICQHFKGDLFVVNSIFSKPKIIFGSAYFENLKRKESIDFFLVISEFAKSFGAIERTLLAVSSAMILSPFLVVEWVTKKLLIYKFIPIFFSYIELPLFFIFRSLLKQNVIIYSVKKPKLKKILTGVSNQYKNENTARGVWSMILKMYAMKVDEKESILDWLEPLTILNK